MAPPAHRPFSKVHLIDIIRWRSLRQRPAPHAPAANGRAKARPSAFFALMSSTVGLATNSAQPMALGRVFGGLRRCARPSGSRYGLTKLGTELSRYPCRTTIQAQTAPARHWPDGHTHCRSSWPDGRAQGRKPPKTRPYEDANIPVTKQQKAALWRGLHPSHQSAFASILRLDLHDRRAVVVADP
jgi:hypothetical protein